MTGHVAVRQSFIGPAFRLCKPCFRRYLQTSPTVHVSRPSTIDSPSRPSKPRRALVPPKSFKSYSKQEIEELKKEYTPQQMSAILAGEEAVDPHDLAEQGAFRTNDPWCPEYFDDFSKNDLILDRPLRAPSSHHDPNIRYKTEDEIKADFADWVSNLPPNPTEREFQDFSRNYRLTVGKEEAERNPINYFAPAIPKHMPGLAEFRAKAEADMLDPEIERLVKSTGFTPQEIRSFRSKIMVTHRVVNQTKLGKIQQLYVLTIVGNQKGLLGIGEGKSAEIGDARNAAYGAAVRNMKPIPRYEQRTIFGDVRAKVGGTDVELYNRPPGFGIRCQHLIWEMCKCAGISDLAARVGRSRNKMNTIKATFKALMNQRDPEEVALGLGKKLVDVRKVYYAGNV